MIKTFAHKGLKEFFETGSVAGIQAKHEKKLFLILYAIHGADEIKDLNSPSFYLHPLKGKMQGLWSIRVNGNWRVVFRFEDGNAYVLNYLDYH